jgi:hypothetical protein
MLEKTLFTLAFARLTFLAATCPCDPLFACHAVEAASLSGVAAGLIIYRVLISK